MKAFQRLFLLVCFGVALAQAQSTTLALSTPAAAVAPGGSAVVTMTLANQAGAIPSGIQFTLGVTSDVTAVVGTIGAAGTAAGKTLSCGPLAGNAITCIEWGLNATAFGPGVVATFNMTIAATATAPSDQILLTNISAADAASDAVTINATNGASIIVQSPCDLNADGVIGMADVNLVIAQALGQAACTTGDLNGDKKCGIVDVIREVLAAMPVTPTVPGSGVCKVGP